MRTARQSAQPGPPLISLFRMRHSSNMTRPRGRKVCAVSVGGGGRGAGRASSRPRSRARPVTLPAPRGTRTSGGRTPLGTSGTRADAEGTRRENAMGARQGMSSLESWSIAFRIWSACVVLGSSLRSSATNSSRLALMPRTSSNEAKYASASATDNLNAFGSSVSTKETIHWMQSSRATMTPWSRGPVRQSRCAPLRGLEFHPHLASGSTTEVPAQHSIQQVAQSPVRERTNGRC